MREIEPKSLSKETNELLATLAECRESCTIGLMHSLNEDGDFTAKDHIVWLLDCAEICNVTTNFLLRDSEYSGDIINICSYICEDCAESCESFFEDANMKNCGEICRKCADKCRDAVDVEEIEENITEVEDDIDDSDEEDEKENNNK
jgi:hypothetical protein